MRNPGARAFASAASKSAARDHAGVDDPVAHVLDREEPPLGAVLTRSHGLHEAVRVDLDEAVILEDAEHPGPEVRIAVGLLGGCLDHDPVQGGQRLGERLRLEGTHVAFLDHDPATRLQCRDHVLDRPFPLRNVLQHGAPRG